MKTRDVTVEILKQIRDEARKTNERLDQTNERLDQTNERLGKLEHRQSETEVRLASELVALSKAVDGVRDLLATRLDLKEKVDEHERRIVALEQHATH